MLLYNTGMLYIVGTPIGNMEDISFRQARTLLECDILLTEDTRTTGLLLNRIHTLFDPLFDDHHRKAKPQLISYYKDNEFDKLPFVLDLIRDGKEMCLISQAGMPLVSDPGYLLIKSVIKEGIPYTVIPGPTAITTAIVHSGFKPDNFMFIGFLPKKTGEIRKLFDKIKHVKEQLPDMVVVFYEAPHRIKETLELLTHVLPEADIVITRELTKKFEEIIRGKALELSAKEYKVEITVLIK